MTLRQKFKILAASFWVIGGAHLSMQTCANEWAWQEPCVATENKTDCSVWFNTPTVVQAVTVSQNETVFDTVFNSFSAQADNSANIVFLQVPALRSAEQLQPVKNGLNDFVNALAENQKMGLYADANSLHIVAALGATPDVIKSSIEQLQPEQTSNNTLKNLQSLASILGGTPHARKVIHWVTTGFELGDEKVQALSVSLNENNVRLVVVVLQQSELDSNLSASFNALLNATTGTLVSAAADAWEATILQSAAYSNNGGAFSFGSAGLCGENTLVFSANALSTEAMVAYPACDVPATPEPTTEPTPEVTPEPALEETPEATLLDVTAETAEATAVEADVETTSAEVTEADGEQPVEAVTEPADLEEEYAEPIDGVVEPTNHTPVIAGVIALLLVLVVIVIVLMRKNKSAPIQTTVFAHLFVYGDDGEKSHEVSAVTTRLGRGSSNDIIISSDTVSSSHALIKRERDGSVTLVDLNSSNGTKVNNQVITQTTLQSGDFIMLGECSLKIQFTG